MEGTGPDCSSWAVAQCLLWSHRMCRNVNAVYRKPLSKQKPSALAHSFGFSSPIVPQDNLTTSPKANSVNGRAAAPTPRCRATEACASAGPAQGGAAAGALRPRRGALRPRRGAGAPRAHSQTVRARPEGDQWQPPAPVRDTREGAAGAPRRDGRPCVPLQRMGRQTLQLKSLLSGRHLAVQGPSTWR